jgi:hypothetical protein
MRIGSTELVCIEEEVVISLLESPKTIMNNLGMIVQPNWSETLSWLISEMQCQRTNWSGMSNLDSLSTWIFIKHLLISYGSGSFFDSGISRHSSDFLGKNREVCGQHIFDWWFRTEETAVPIRKSVHRNSCKMYGHKLLRTEDHY